MYRLDFFYKRFQIGIGNRNPVRFHLLDAGTFVLCDEALATAGVKAKDIDMVVLAGGTTMLPMIRSGVEGYFGKTPMHHLDPLSVVSIGASLAPLL